MPERHLVLTYDYVEDIIERRAPLRAAHLGLIEQAKAAGRLVMAGAVGDPPHSGMLVFRDGGEPEAFAREDPYVTSGIVTAWRVEPWMVV